MLQISNSRPVLKCFLILTHKCYSCTARTLEVYKSWLLVRLILPNLSTTNLWWVDQSSLIAYEWACLVMPQKLWHFRQTRIEISGSDAFSLSLRWKISALTLLKLVSLLLRSSTKSAWELSVSLFRTQEFKVSITTTQNYLKGSHLTGYLHQLIRDHPWAEM